jgi:shikimate kinase
LDQLARGKAEAPGAATIVNAMATGSGAAFAIDLKVVASVTLDDSGDIRGSIVNEPDEDTGLIELCVRKALGRAGEQYGAAIETRSDLPMARGLSSSSAASNAVVLATASAMSKVGHEMPTDQEESPSPAPTTMHLHPTLGEPWSPTTREGRC